VTGHPFASRADWATRVARDAGALALRYFRRELAFATEVKGPQDFVTVADRAVETFIREHLQREFPNDGFLGEEAGGAIVKRVWCVDPIDGTINFVHGVHYWCISIAFVVDQRAMIGIVYDAVADEMFVAIRGSGAFCNGAPMRVSACSRVDQALVCAGFCTRHSIAAHIAQDGRLLAAGAAVKDMGAGALMLAHVAAGRYDAYLEPHMQPWDALAGLLLVDEAGGRTLPYPGTSGLAAGGEVVASTPEIYTAVAALRVPMSQPSR
jgi:myo-inositol-1(or 4)-monophosphatase